MHFSPFGTLTFPSLDWSVAGPPTAAGQPLGAAVDGLVRGVIG